MFSSASRYAGESLQSPRRPSDALLASAPAQYGLKECDLVDATRV